ncbi:hypothetical protein BH09ACT3_BH09ACT3_05400 [soil metagenome]
MTVESALSGGGFDVRGYARTAHGSHRSKLDLAAYATAPIGADSLAVIRYLGRLESGTMEQLRNLLVTATHKDARVTAFLVTWAFEKFWIADALDAVLEASGMPRLRAEKEGRSSRRRSEAAVRRGPIRRAVLALNKGFPIVGVHSTLGLIDEWVMDAAYLRLDERAGSPALSETIGIVRSVKQRHREFFDQESRRRLAESGRTVALTRKELGHATWPIGAVDRAATDRTFFERYVFDGEGSTIASSIAAKVAGLPGLDERIGASVAKGLRS